jgi:phage I-like protein
MASWFQRNDVNNESGQNTPPLEINLTDTQYDSIADKVAKKIQIPDVNAAIESNPTIKAIADALKANADRRTQQQTREQQQLNQQQQQTFEEAYAEMDESTRTVVDQRFNQLQEQSLRTGARETRRSVFEDIENYPYYTGDIKRQVDDILDKEPLQNQNNPQIVKNAYKVVLADNIEKLQKNELKSRLSSASGSSVSTTSGPADPNALPELTAEEKQYAIKMGVSEQDWAKQKKELILAGEVVGV